ncbi:DUF3558 domain-containing protein [Amycolatopsis taiwanensis]|uniref:DUF3558 domain-containing protein n=1 Tax=Amycolatopsis taiwanensis TaxID=342230 RepID=UPI000487B25E|nr:DUF3558 domain-containing protein [Amycolatopsis taiwanensis]
MISKASVASFAALVATAAMAVTGCSSTIAGTASPATTSRTGTASGNVFDALNACQVLDQLLAGQGFHPGDNQNTRNECTTSKLDFGAYSIALDPTRGLTEFAASNVGATQTVVNGRNAMQAEPSPGMCVYALEVGQNALALALANMASSTDNAQACPNAEQLAEKLEPLLPKDQ